MSRPSIHVPPYDEDAPSAGCIGYEMTAPPSKESFNLAVETLVNGLAVLVVGDTWPKVEIWASGLESAIRRPGPGESVH